MGSKAATGTSDIWPRPRAFVVLRIFGFVRVRQVQAACNILLMVSLSDRIISVSVRDF